MSTLDHLEAVDLTDKTTKQLDDMMEVVCVMMDDHGDDTSGYHNRLEDLLTKLTNQREKPRKSVTEGTLLKKLYNTPTN